MAYQEKFTEFPLPARLAQKQLFIEEITSNGNYPTTTLRRANFRYLTIQALGNWGSGGTLQLQHSVDNSNWVNVSGASLASDGIMTAEDPLAPYIRLNLSGATNPDLDVYLFLHGRYY